MLKFWLFREMHCERCHKETNHYRRFLGNIKQWCCCVCHHVDVEETIDVPRITIL